MNAYNFTKTELLYKYFTRLLPIIFWGTSHSFLKFSEHLFYRKSFNNCVCMCVYVCVCVCVCVCVYVCVFILFHRKGFFRLQRCLGHTWGYGSTILCCKYFSRSFCQAPSCTFLEISYFISKDKTPARQENGEKTPWYIGNLQKEDIYWYRI